MSQQRHWKSSLMSPSRVDNYVYHINEEHYYQVAIYEVAPLSTVPVYLDAIYYDGYLYFNNTNIKATLSKIDTAGVREFINDNWYELTARGLRTYNESHLNKFLCDLLKLSPTSELMSAGTAVHEYLEKLLIGEVPASFTNNGWNISVNQKLNCELHLPLQREQWASKYFGDILILGKADCLGCDIIHDLKTTKKLALRNM